MGLVNAGSGLVNAGLGPVGAAAIGAIAPPKTYKSNFFHHDFVQFRKKAFAI